MPSSRKASAARAVLGLLLLLLLPGASRAHHADLVEVTVSFSPEGDYKIEVPINPAQLLQRIEVAEGKALTDEPTARQIREGIDRGLPGLVRKVKVIFDGQEVAPRFSFVEREETDLVLRRGDPARGRRCRRGRRNSSSSTSWCSPRYALKVQAADGGEPAVAWLEGAELSPPMAVVLPRPPTLFEVVKTYVPLGFDHILPKGLDHILFVLGLFLLCARWKPLLWQVTSFTAAHTITLGLATFGVVSLPSSIVEPLIALSIVYVAIENVVHEKLGRFRVVVVFFFGLLHGLGFAGVLRELGLPKSQVVAGAAFVQRRRRARPAGGDRARLSAARLLGPEKGVVPPPDRGARLAFDRRGRRLLDSRADLAELRLKRRSSSLAAAAPWRTRSVPGVLVM